MQRFAHLCLIVGSIALASCRTASQPLSLDSDSQATVPSVLPADASQLLIGGDELIVQTAGEWTIRQENGVEIREPSGYGSHSVQVVAINGNSLYGTIMSKLSTYIDRCASSSTSASMLPQSTKNFAVRSPKLNLS